MSMTRQPMTPAEVREAIGHERPAWAETLGSTPRLVILVRAGDHDAVLVARATEREPQYQWISAGHVTRRADLDGNPEPAWLQRARASRRPPQILHDILNPTYSRRALTVVSTDTPQAIVDELTYRSYAYNRTRSPHLSPEQWARVFPNWQALEARFQAEGGQTPPPFTVFGGAR